MIAQRDVAVLEAGAAFLEHVLGLADRLLATGDDDVELPARMGWSAIAMALMPGRHTLLMVRAGTFIGIPAATAALRAGIWPAAAVRTWPMITYST